MIERKIEIGGKPLKISDHNRKGVIAITTKRHLSDVFNNPRPQTNTNYVDYGETYAVMSFKYVYGSVDDLSVGAQILRKFDQWYYGVTSSNMIFWYRGLFPLLNKDPMLVQRLQNIVRVAAPDIFRIKNRKEDGGAKDFADAVFAKRTDNKIKELILNTFKSQRTFENFSIDLVEESLDKGTINVAFQFVAGEVPKFAGIKVFGSRELKTALKKDAMFFYRGFIAPHMSIFESRMRDAFMSGNFTVNQPQTLGQNPAFQAVFDQFGRTASQDSLRAKVIRLAHQNPELRKDLLPLLKEARLHDKALALRIQNSTAGKAFGLYFIDAFKSNRPDSDGAITYVYRTNIVREYVGQVYKEEIYIDVTKWDSDDEMYSVQAKHGKGTWDYYSEKDFLRALPNVLANLKKQLG